MFMTDLLVQSQLKGISKKAYACFNWDPLVTHGVEKNTITIQPVRLPKREICDHQVANIENVASMGGLMVALEGPV